MLAIAALRIRILWNGGMEDEDSYAATQQLVRQFNESALVWIRSDTIREKHQKNSLMEVSFPSTVIWKSTWLSLISILDSLNRYLVVNRL